PVLARREGGDGVVDGAHLRGPGAVGIVAGASRAHGRPPRDATLARTTGQRHGGSGRQGPRRGGRGRATRPRVPATPPPLDHHTGSDLTDAGVREDQATAGTVPPPPPPPPRRLHDA